MDINEIVKNATEVIRWGIIGGLSYASLLGGTSIICNLFNHNKRMKSKEELLKVVEEESSRLNLDHNKFKIRHTTFDDGANLLGFVSGDSSGNYELGIPSSFGCTRNTVKHELVHVANKDYMHGALHYLFIGEPRAILYGTFGIKI